VNPNKKNLEFQQKSEKFRNIDQWRDYFHPNCVISTKYHTVSDGTKLFSILTQPPNKIENIRPIIIIPGWFSLISGWLDVVNTISEFTTIAYFESREKNTSILASNKVDMSVNRMVLDLCEVRDDLGVEFKDAIVLGSSMGGTTIFKYLVDQNISANLFVLIGPNPSFDAPKIITPILLKMPLFIYKVTKAYVKWHVLRFKIDRKKEPEQAQKYIDVLEGAENWKIRQSARKCLKFNVWRDLHLINANILLVGASLDKMHAAERTLKLKKLIKNASYIDFESNKKSHSEEFGKFMVEIAHQDWDSIKESYKIIE